jgi:hypothetical protein
VQNACCYAPDFELVAVLDLSFLEVWILGNEHRLSILEIAGV